jgi:hypothetical protein
MLKILAVVISTFLKCIRKDSENHDYSGLQVPAKIRTNAHNSTE